MSQEYKEIDRFAAPFNREIVVQETVFDNGFPMLRLTVRERRRFTTIDLDPQTAQRWGDMLKEWAEAQDLSDTEQTEV